MTSAAPTAPAVACALQEQSAPHNRPPPPPPPPGPSSVPMSPSAIPAGSAARDGNEPSGGYGPASAYHTDGRVKNPVPNKLKGITNNENGNFAVMHIDLGGHKISDRNAAAKRTSEGTEEQARRATKVSWQSAKRIKPTWNGVGDLDLQPPGSLPSPLSAPHLPPGLVSSSNPTSLPGLPSTSTSPPCQQSPLPPGETKQEQARLLTLLRTLHPVQVVDQLCKGLAYFGGIPGAPPPLDGNFPCSVAANGSGSLLVGWLAEIFPPVDGAVPTAIGQAAHLPPLSAVADQASWGRPDSPLAADGPKVPAKRPRGRPKGSKSSKVRKDKGIKKSRPAASFALLSGQAEAKSNVADGVNPPSAVHDAMAPVSAAALDANSHADSSMTTTPGAKKRGRPKGSKNRPKMIKPDASQDYGDSTAKVATTTTQSPPWPRLGNPSVETQSASGQGHNGPSVADGLPGGGMQNEVLGAPIMSPNEQHHPPMPTSYTSRVQGPGSLGAANPSQSTKAETAARFMGSKRAATAMGSPTTDWAARQGEVASGHASARTKRRRFSKETSLPAGVGIDALQGLPGDMATPPGALNHALGSGASPPLSSTRGFDAHSASNGGPVQRGRAGPGQGLQQHNPFQQSHHHHHHHHHQQQQQQHPHPHPHPHQQQQQQQHHHQHQRQHQHQQQQHLQTQHPSSPPPPQQQLQQPPPGPPPPPAPLQQPQQKQQQQQPQAQQQSQPQQQQPQPPAPPAPPPPPPPPPPSQQQQQHQQQQQQQRNETIQSLVPPRPRSQMAGPYGGQPANVSPQMLFSQQRQMAAQVGNFGRAGAGGPHYSPTMARQGSGGSGNLGPGLPQQRAASGGPRAPGPHEGSGAFAGQTHHPPGPPPPPNSSNSSNNNNNNSNRSSSSSSNNNNNINNNSSSSSNNSNSNGNGNSNSNSNNSNNSSNSSNSNSNSNNDSNSNNNSSNNSSNNNSSNNNNNNSSSSNSMGPFHGYGEQSYLNMDYGLTERDVQDAAEVTAFGSPTQLEAALTQPKMRNGMFQTIGRP